MPLTLDLTFPYMQARYVFKYLNFHLWDDVDRVLFRVLLVDRHIEAHVHIFLIVLVLKVVEEKLQML